MAYGWSLFYAAWVGGQAEEGVTRTTMLTVPLCGLLWLAGVYTGAMHSILVPYAVVNLLLGLALALALARARTRTTGGQGGGPMAGLGISSTGTGVSSKWRGVWSKLHLG